MNYTTYNLQRGQDIIHPSAGKADILVYAPDAVNSDYSYPWMYARVLGIYHANVIPPGSVSAQRVEFFHVHWLSTDGTIASGTSVWHLEHIHFVPNDTGAFFGFVHPSHAVHVISSLLFVTVVLSIICHRPLPVTQRATGDTTP